MHYQQRIRTFLVVLIAALFLGAGALAQNGADQPTQEELEQTLENLTTRYEETWAQGNWEEVANFYSEDAWVSWPTSTVTVGREAIVSYQTSGEQTEAALEITTEEVMMAGEDTPLARGSYRSVAPDGTTVSQGNWMVVYEIVDGEWYVQWQVLNLTPPETE
jgi:uncharacterized protein (TIGR02246 family)